MAMTREELKQAFREAVSAEFADIPYDEDSIDYTFSKHFTDQMNKLINAQKKPYYYLVNTAAKRAAVVFVAIITLFAASMSIKAIREPVVEFIIEIYETFNKYFFEGDTADELKKEYTITKLPEGFVEISRTESKVIRIKTYENSKGYVIEFTQFVTKEAINTVDNESTNTYIKKIHNKEIYITNFKEQIILKWIENGYYFEITSYGNVSVEKLLEMVKSIE